MPKKMYNAPFWIFLCIATYLTGMNVLASIKFEQTVKRYNLQGVHFPYWTFVWPLLFFAEAAIYRIIRKKILRRSYVIWHIILTVFGFIIMPFVVIATTAILSRLKTPTEYYPLRATILTVRMILFWVLLATGQAFFIATIVKAFRKKENEETGGEQSPNLLDGILEES